MQPIDVRNIKRVACIGTGTIGARWAAYFLSRGLEVTASDPSPTGEDFLRRHIRECWPTLERLGVSANADPDRLSFFADPAEAVAEADFVQESAPERLDLKQDLLARIDAACPADRIIASSTSGFMASELQTKCAHPERVLIGHPFNPPHIIPAVEVVGGKKTAPEAVDSAVDFYNLVGKRAIKLNKEVTGHVVNRLQAALWREAVYLAAEGVASVADIDDAIAYGPGLRWAIMGPTITFHLAGGEGGMPHFLEQFTNPMHSWWDALGSPRLTPEVKKTIMDGVEDEAAGRTPPELAAERDRCLLALLEALAKQRKAG